MAKKKKEKKLPTFDGNVTVEVELEVFDLPAKDEDDARERVEAMLSSGLNIQNSINIWKCSAGYRMHGKTRREKPITLKNRIIFGSVGDITDCDIYEGDPGGEDE